MKAQLWKNDEKVGEVLFNEDTGRAIADMDDPNDQAQVDSVIELAEPPPATMGGFVGAGEMDEITQDPDDTWFKREILQKLESLGFDYRIVEEA
jgi:hypothetical protein